VPQFTGTITPNVVRTTLSPTRVVAPNVATVTQPLVGLPTATVS
jgi:hypothetical protein